MPLLNQDLIRSRLSQEEINKIDLEEGSKKSLIRKKIEDAKLREELKYLDLSSTEFLDIFS